MGVVATGETPSLTGESIREAHRVLEHTQVHLPRNHTEKGTIHLWEVREVTESWARAKNAALILP